MKMGGGDDKPASSLTYISLPLNFRARLRRVKAKEPIKADNNNQTAKDKGACEARLIDCCIIRIGSMGLEQMAMIKNTNILTNAIAVGSFINNDFNAFIYLARTIHARQNFIVF